MTHTPKGRILRPEEGDEDLPEAIELPAEDVDELTAGFRNEVSRLFPRTYHQAEAIFHEFRGLGLNFASRNADDRRIWTDLMPVYMNMTGKYDPALLRSVLAQMGYRIDLEPGSRTPQAVIRTDSFGRQMAHVYDPRKSPSPRVLTLEQYAFEFPQAA